MGCWDVTSVDKLYVFQVAEGVLVSLEPQNWTLRGSCLIVFWF